MSFAPVLSWCARRRGGVAVHRRAAVDCGTGCGFSVAKVRTRCLLDPHEEPAALFGPGAQAERVASCCLANAPSPAQFGASRVDLVVRDAQGLRGKSEER